MAKKGRAKRSLGGCIESLLILTPVWVLVGLLLLTMTPVMLRAVRELGLPGAGGIGPSAPGPGSIPALFTREVRHWGGDIDRWAAGHELDPSLVATVMQIESCGHPRVSSVAGAQGLFQVMPYHFESGEDAFAPETNAARGLAVLNDCLALAGGDVGRAMACYNGGPGTLDLTFAAWPQEARDYYIWATGIYEDAQAGLDHSATLDRWLAAGGAGLCSDAAGALGLD
jgi:hypothetical protein